MINSSYQIIFTKIHEKSWKHTCTDILQIDRQTYCCPTSHSLKTLEHKTHRNSRFTTGKHYHKEQCVEEHVPRHVIHIRHPAQCSRLSDRGEAEDLKNVVLSAERFPEVMPRCVALLIVSAVVNAELVLSYY